MYLADLTFPDLYLLNHRLGFKDAVKMDLQSNTDGSITRRKIPKTAFESDRLYKNLILRLDHNPSQLRTELS